MYRCLKTLVLDSIFRLFFLGHAILIIMLARLALEHKKKQKAVKEN